MKNISDIEYIINRMTTKTETVQCECDKYIATPETAKDVVEQYGVAIIPNVLNDEECTKMNEGIWDVLEYLTQDWNGLDSHGNAIVDSKNQPIPVSQINRNNKNTWGYMSYLYPKHSMLIQNWGIGHAQHIWDVRQNPKVVNVFSEIWRCNPEDLLVSFDATSFHIPPEYLNNKGWYKNKDWMHSDQSFLNNNLICIQGFVTANDVNEGDATLQILESSNRYHAEFQRRFNTTEKNDWYKLNDVEKSFYVTENNCKPVRIKCNKGSLVLWDSRTIHCCSEPIKPIEKRPVINFRNVVYVCYLPRNSIPEEKERNKILKKKRDAFLKLRMTSHWPNKVTLFPKKPYTYGKPILNVQEIQPPNLTELGRKLAGFDN